MMDGEDRSGYVSYLYQAIQHDPRARVQGSANFIPGKDMNALSLSERASFSIDNSRRDEECYANIGANTFSIKICLLLTHILNIVFDGGREVCARSTDARLVQH